MKFVFYEESMWHHTGQALGPSSTKEEGISERRAMGRGARVAELDDIQLLVWGEGLFYLSVGRFVGFGVSRFKKSNRFETPGNYFFFSAL